MSVVLSKILPFGNVHAQFLTPFASLFIVSTVAPTSSAYISRVALKQFVDGQLFYSGLIERRLVYFPRCSSLNILERSKKGTRRPRAFLRKQLSMHAYIQAVAFGTVGKI